MAQFTQGTMKITQTDGLRTWVLPRTSLTTLNCPVDKNQNSVLIENGDSPYFYIHPIFCNQKSVLDRVVQQNKTTFESLYQ